MFYESVSGKFAQGIIPEYQGWVLYFCSLIMQLNVAY